MSSWLGCSAELGRCWPGIDVAAGVAALPRSAERARRLAAAIVDRSRGQHFAAARRSGHLLRPRRQCRVQPTRRPSSAFGPINPASSLYLKFRAPEIRQLVESTRSAERNAAADDYVERLPVERVLPCRGSSHLGSDATFRAGLQGPERGAPHRPHARRLHRQCQP